MEHWWWAILPSWVLCFAKLLSPHRLHQFAKSASPNCQLHVTRVTCQLINSTSNCALSECSPNCSEKRVIVLVYYPSYLGWFRTLSVIYGHNNNNNNNNVQFSIILKTEVIVLESFIQIFGMAGIHFSEFLAIPKSN
jgi:hypothetical protein